MSITIEHVMNALMINMKINALMDINSNALTTFDTTLALETKN